MEKYVTSAKILEQTLAHVAPLPSQWGYAKALASIFAMHIHRNELIDDGFAPDELPTASAIVVAPTGQGKTYLVRKMAECLDLNVITVDCSTLVAEGYKGAALSERFLGARDSAKNRETFERSIIFLDEADKLAAQHEYSLSGGGMTSLLQLFNGGTLALPPVNGKSDTINTSRFTILLGGAFEGLDAIIRERICPKPKIGFGSEAPSATLSTAELLEQATGEDLVRFGMMRELVGRVGTILSISPLGKEDYRLLLNAESGSVRKRYHNYFANLFGVAFEISEAGVSCLSDKCLTAKTGARAATPLVDRWMREAIAEVERDNSICRVILDANAEGCFVRYEQGQRGYAFRNPARAEVLENLDWHVIKAKDTRGLTQKLLRYYRNAGGKLDFLPTLEAYLNCTLKYLHQTARPNERTFDSLEKLARATRKEGKHSAFEIIMEDAKFVFLPEYRAFAKEYDSWTPQNLVSALHSIMEYLQGMHGVCRVKFELFDPKQPPMNKD